MRYFLTCLHLTLRQRLGSLRNWLILLLLPVIILSASLLLPESDTASPVTVGVVLPENGGDALWELLQARNDDILSFTLTDADTLDRNIAAGRWDCGIILARDFDKKVAELDTDRIFTLRIGPSSTVYPLVRETISACMGQLISPDIARDYLKDSGIADSSIPLSLEDPDRVLVSLTTLDGKPIQAPELAARGIRAFLRWFVCVSILVRMLFGTADLSKWTHSPGMKRMHPLQSPFCSMAARVTADALLLFLSGASALLLLGDGLRGCAAVLGYVWFWLAVSLLLAQFPKITTAIHLFIPFAVVLSFLMSSVLMDISLIFPQLASVSHWLPAAMFLRICNGHEMDLLLLLIAGMLAMLIGWIATHSRQNKI